MNSCRMQKILLHQLKRLSENVKEKNRFGFIYNTRENLIE